MKPHAYVMSVMRGSGFCASGKMAFDLQKAKKTSLLALTRQSVFIYRLSKLVFTFTAVFLASELVE